MDTLKMKLGDRIKTQFENITRLFLPAKNFAIIRVDGKGFSKYTQDLEKPFDNQLISDMNETAIFLCQNIQGAKLAYVQSDEISIIFTDLINPTSQLWFGGNIQKIASISASLATAKFNELRPGKLAFFDSRVFTVSKEKQFEVGNYLIFRQEDATKNSIQMFARSVFSHREINNKNTKDMRDMCLSKGKNWEDCPEGFKYGRMILKETYLVDNTIDASLPQVERSRWVASPAMLFKNSKQQINEILDKNEETESK